MKSHTAKKVLPLYHTNLYPENVDTVCINSFALVFPRLLKHCKIVHVYVNKYFKIIHCLFPLVRENKSILKKVSVVQIFLFYFISKTNLIPTFIASFVCFVLHICIFLLLSVIRSRT